MRKNIVHPGADELTYEIREIVRVAKQLEEVGLSISWENIGDPVAKGEKVPEWIKDIVSRAAQEDETYGYSPTQGLLEAREYIAYERNIEGLPAERQTGTGQAEGVHISSDDILFFNGLGDAISKVYSYLNPHVRVIGPNPAYPTHSSAEAAHADSSHITYRLDPENGWAPDMEELENKVKYNPQIAGILIINPDNPTGFIYPKETLQRIVRLAREYNLFVISDEIYSNLWYGEEHKKLASVISDVPGIAMRGLSKEIPWPGGRSGWLEFYNRDKDENFNRYTKSLLDAKMLEVCSTTLPQKVLPEIMKDERYYPYLEERKQKYKKRAETIAEMLGDMPELIVHKPSGAFYMSIVFKDGVLKEGQRLEVTNKKAQDVITALIETESLDKRFVYFLLAATGICVVPLSGFNSDLYGFRMTLLETDDEVFKDTVTTLKQAIEEYLTS